jgi:hypothetical protein
MHFLCFATGNKCSRVDKMPTSPLEQKVIKRNVLKKEGSAKIFNTTENVFGNNRRLARDKIPIPLYAVRF